MGSKCKKRIRSFDWTERVRKRESRMSDRDIL